MGAKIKAKTRADLGLTKGTNSKNSINVAAKCSDHPFRKFLDPPLYNFRPHSARQWQTRKLPIVLCVPTHEKYV